LVIANPDAPMHISRMSRPPLSIVIARAQNGVIGCDNALPWHLPEDLKRFKRLTSGTAMIMGRRTFESLPGLLPGRRHIVLTRNPRWRAPGAEVVHGVEEALERLKGERGTVIGGAEIFELFLPIVDKIELTEVYARPAGDAVISDPKKMVHRFRSDLVAEFPKTHKQPRFQFWTLSRCQNDFQENLLTRAFA
jgi:dihydrofolate reductase